MSSKSRPTEQGETQQAWASRDDCITDLSQFNLEPTAPEAVAAKAHQLLVAALEVCLENSREVGQLPDTSGLDLAETALIGFGTVALASLTLVGAISLPVMPVAIGGSWIAAQVLHSWRHGSEDNSWASSTS